MLSRQDLANSLNMSISGIDKLRLTDPKFPKPMRFGRVLRWTNEQLQAYIASCQVSDHVQAKDSPQDKQMSFQA